MSRLTWLGLWLAAGLACGPPRPIEPVLALQGDAARGAATYQNVCAGCHGAEGYGIARAPALVGSVPKLTDVEIVSVMLHGRGGMPAKRIDDQQAADVLAWMRATWSAAPASPGASPPR